MSMTGNYQIVVGKIATVMEEVGPPEGVAPGPFSFAGYLRDYTGIPLNGKTVNLLIDGVVAGTTTTGVGIGFWSFVNFYIGAGKHTICAEFPGDASYEPSRTFVYTRGEEVPPPPPPEIPWKTIAIALGAATLAFGIVVISRR